jgi:TonB family protein
MNNITDIQDIANALGWTLVHFVWQGALIFLAYWVLTRLFCKNRINMHYWVGMFFMMICLVVPIYEFISQLNSTTTGGVLHELRIQVSSIGDNGILSTKEMIVTLIQMSIPYVVLIWGISVLLISSHLFKSWLALIKLSKVKSDIIPGYLLKRFKQALVQLKLKLKPLIVISNKIDIPATFGYFKPIVLIPAAMITKLPQEQMEAILLHELCHIKRADFLHNIIQLLVETLFFYHPLTKWVSRDIRKVREQCCDNLVLELGASPMVYAKALTNIALIQNSLTTSHLQIAANDGELFERIKFLMLKKQRKSPSITIMTIMAVFITFMILANNLFNKSYTVDSFVSSNSTENRNIKTEVKKPTYSIMDALTGLNQKQESKPIEKPNAELKITSEKIQNKNNVVENQLISLNTIIENTEPLPVSIENSNLNEALNSSIEPEITIVNETFTGTNPKLSPISKLNEKLPVYNSNYPKLIKMVNPEYKKSARERGIEGTVILSFNIDIRGKVNKISVDKSSPLKLLDGNARQALRKWRFDPNSINQNILNNRYQQIFSFNLNETGNCIDGDIGTRLAKNKVCR